MRPIHPRGTSREHHLSAQKQAVLNAAYRCPECGKWITDNKYMKSPHEHRKEETNAENQDDQAGLLGLS